MVNGLNKVGEWDENDYENEYKIASQFFCPFSVSEKSVVIHNKMSNFHTIPVGLNKTNDNDIAYTTRSFNLCAGPDCMAYDIETRTCKRCMS